MDSGNTSRNSEAEIIFKLQKFVLNKSLGLLHVCLTVWFGRILVLGAVNHTRTRLELSSLCALCRKEETALRKESQVNGMASLVLALPGWEVKSARGSGAPHPAPFPLHTRSGSRGMGFSAKGLIQLWATGGSKCHCGDKA